jgi:PKD repeat protein
LAQRATAFSFLAQPASGKLRRRGFAKSGRGSPCRLRHDCDVYFESGVRDTALFRGASGCRDRPRWATASFRFTTGYGTGATAFGSSGVTLADGSFSLPGPYVCSTTTNGNNTLIYLTATGGNPGLAATGGTTPNNTALVMMTTLGTCGSIGPSTQLTVNEVSTVSTVYALAQFMNANGGVGAYGSSMQGLANAFATVNNLVSTATGVALVVTPNGNGIAPQAKINALANSAAACVNSSGPSSPGCIALFNVATPAGGNAPTNTVGAILNIAQNPSNQASKIVGVAGTQVPFQPAVVSANDWTLTIAYATGGTAPSSLALDSVGNLWVANYGTGGTNSSVSFVSPLGVTATNSPFTSSTYINGAVALAVDGGNNAWLANRDNNSAAELNAVSNGTSYTIGSVSGPYASAGLSTPVAVAVDRSSNVWFVNNGTSSLTELNHANYGGTPNTLTSATLSAPRQLAFDISGNGWVANNTGATVAKLNATATPVPFTSYPATGLSGPAAIALDGASNVWLTDSTVNAVAKLDRNGIAVSSSSGFAGGGISGANGDAIDGLGNLWVADTTSNHISVLNPSGQAVSAATGYQDASLSMPTSLAIDGSGNVWVANNTPTTSGALQLTVSEMVGAAAPVVTPLSLAAGQAQLAFRPGTPQPKAVTSGPYTGTTGTAVTFIGSNSTDPGGEALSYSWSFGDGSVGTGAVATHTFTTAGTYTAVLTVTNTDGYSGVVTTLTVVSATPAQTPTVVAGGPYSGTTAAPIQFTAAGSFDPANPGTGTVGLSYNWNFGDGTSSAGPSPLHTFALAGTYTVTLTATSPSGGTASATVTAMITTGTVAAGTPTANPGGPYTGTTTAAVSFNGSGSSDPNNLALTYGWDFGDGGSSTAVSPTHTYSKPGTFSVALTVYNGATQSIASTTATITAPPVPAIVVNPGGPYTGILLQPIALTSSGTTNPALRQLSYTWDYGDGNTGTGPAPSHIYSKAGVYTVSLSVSDGASQSGSATTQATVTAPATEAITASAGGPYQNIPGQTIVFDASASADNFGNTLSYSWNFGDGSTGTGVQASHSYSAPGTYTATVTETTGTLTASATANAVISTPISVTITSPTANALFGTSAITVSGTLSAPNLTVMVNGVAAQVNGTSFTATGVTLREGVNVVSATAMDGIGGVGTGVVSVILDLTAPTVSITSPANGSTLSSSQITVAGLVTDVVTGTVGSNNVKITVNGQTAQVSNRSYVLSNLQLVPGSNTITVVATDNVGNTGQTTATVQLLPANTQLSIVKVSGDLQSGTVQSVLPQPLVVQLLSASGTPVAGRPITFTVTRSDGSVEVMPNIAQTLTVTSNTAGQASVLFQLGSRSGLGINQVSATTPGVSAAAVFTATTSSGVPAQIRAVTGENQRGLLGEQLGGGFQAIVMDANSNPVPGVTVNFTSVGASDGTLDNPNPVTDANGKVLVNLTLGQQEGINNYGYTGDFSGDTGSPVTFLASAYAPGPVANTTVSGTVYDNSGAPVPNATVTIANTTLSTVTNTSGNFTINGAPVGTVTLTVDGSTATTTETLPFLSFVLQDLPGQNNTLGKPIYLPAIDVNDAQTVGGSQPVTLTMAGVPGVAFTVAPNSVTFPDGSTVGKLSLSQVKSDLIPMEPTNGAAPNLVWTLQPAGARFSVPVQITLPNTTNLPPGFVTEMYQYDHDLEQFVSVGTGHVSADGSVVTSDPGFGITKAGWGLGASVANANNGCVQSCVSTNECETAKYSPSHCLCLKTPNTGKDCAIQKKVQICADCGDGGLPLYTTVNANDCQNQGKCTSAGVCDGALVAAGRECHTNLDYCSIGGKCNGRGTCVSQGTVPDQEQIDANGSGFAVTAEANLSEVNTFLTSFLQKANTLLAVNTQFTIKGSDTTTLTCCSAKQQMNVPIISSVLNPQFKITSDKLPIVINGVFLGKSVGNGEVLGFYFTLGGSIGGVYTHRDNQCTGVPCSRFTVLVGATLELGFNIPSDYLNINVNGTWGVQAEAGGGCGTATLSLGFQPLVVTGSLKAFNNLNVSATYTYNPNIQLGGEFPIQ